MQLLQLKISLKLQAPILTHTSGAISFGLDAAMQRDKKGRPVFTGSLIRGNLRHAWQDLQDITKQPSQEQIEDWLGKDADDEQQQPKRAKLTFSEYWVDNDWNSKKQIGKRYRISIDEKTGAVTSGALQVLDSPYATGDSPTFSGIITARLNDDDELKELKQWLEYALQMIPAIGALKSNGFGKVLETSIEEMPLDRDKEALRFDTSLLKQVQLGLRIQPQSSFCFAKPARGGGNHFETATHIPAAALVATIASHIEDNQDSYQELNKHLSRLHFNHAHAVPKGIKKRPIALPLSMVEANKQFHDIASNTQAEIINGQAPIFLIDWKDKQFTKAKKHLNFNVNTSPDIQLKIRTAIERTTGTAKDSQLFSMETVSPEGFDWISNISLETVPESDREAVIKQLQQLFASPLSQMGKTKSSMRLSLEKAHTYTIVEQETNAEQVIIYLQSAARLLPTGFQTAGTNQGEKLQQAYKNTWSDLSDNSLQLSHFFAQQQLQGGEHWWKRNRKQKGRYHPEIFTQAGSVFVLEITNKDKAKALLKKWQQQGLPQLNKYTEEWDDNPWIASNGYGEIALNLNIKEGAKYD